MLAAMLVPPPRCAGTFPESTHEPVYGPRPPRRGVAYVNRALPGVACRIFWEGVGVRPPALVTFLKWWSGEKKSLRISQNCLDEGCEVWGGMSQGALSSYFQSEDPRVLLETSKSQGCSL